MKALQWPSQSPDLNPVKIGLQIEEHSTEMQREEL